MNEDQVSIVAQYEAWEPEPNTVQSGNTEAADDAMAFGRKALLVLDGLGLVRWVSVISREQNMLAIRGDHELARNFGQSGQLGKVQGNDVMLDLRLASFRLILPNGRPS